ncbi:unnamed protein product [Moneuplotes crassus]|uniref:Uncharacterized protein n=1 Tax=Euplotes crassus TaxID=5936 RepID=A0AAD1UN25_EUPCR|nr:unnamed protein product [Moneuplotes crassus]
MALLQACLGSEGKMEERYQGWKEEQEGRKWEIGLGERGCVIEMHTIKCLFRFMRHIWAYVIMMRFIGINILVNVVIRLFFYCRFTHSVSFIISDWIPSFWSFYHSKILKFWGLNK